MRACGAGSEARTAAALREMVQCSAELVRPQRFIEGARAQSVQQRMRHLLALLLWEERAV